MQAVRRYLTRKPMTSKDPLQKFKSKRTGLSNDETVKKLASTVRKIQPEQKTIKGKLYLSLKPRSSDLRARRSLVSSLLFHCEYSNISSHNKTYILLRFLYTGRFCRNKQNKRTIVTTIAEIFTCVTKKKYLHEFIY